MWINQGDIILVGLRDYQDAKADVILKYNPDEARNLKSYGELPEYAKINENVAFPGDDEDDDNIIEFGEVSGDESEIDDVSTHQLNNSIHVLILDFNLLNRFRQLILEIKKLDFKKAKFKLYNCNTKRPISRRWTLDQVISSSAATYN